MEHLATWAVQQVARQDMNPDFELWDEQLGAVASMANELLLVLNGHKEEKVDPKTFEQWISAIYGKGDYLNSVAQKGCRCVVDSPAKLISVADSTVWIDTVETPSATAECQFLYPAERERLIEGHHVEFWDGDCQVAYHDRILFNTFLRTGGKLRIVVCRYINGAKTSDDTLLIRLRGMIGNLDKFIVTPKFDSGDLEDVEHINNSPAAMELDFEGGEKLRWPGHMSPTIMDALVKYPFDYLMDRLLGIHNDQDATMGDVNTTKGNVAHAVIQRLFEPRKKGELTTAEEAMRRIDEEFNSVYIEKLEAKGAQLLLAENRLEEKLLRDQLRASVKRLADVMSANGLLVKECELEVEDYLGFGLPERKNSEEGTRSDLLGFLDMELEDENKIPVIFDFKWINYNSERYYRGLLEDNRSIQLAMYRRMLSDLRHENVRRTAYFLMPMGKLYSTSAFRGPNCIQVTPTNSDDIVAQLVNSVRYRKAQLDNGFVELGGALESLEYVQDQESANLYPLEEETDSNKKGTGNRAGNRFSNYKLFI